MYEDKTYEKLLQAKIDFVKNLAREQGHTIDTRTASMIYFALAGNAVETAQTFIEIDQVLNESFADTQTRDFLIRRCRERGIIVYPAARAIRKGEFSKDIPIGARFSLEKLNYAAINKIDDYSYEMECETPGNIGNLESGALVPIEYIDGLEWAQLTDVLIPGEDDEPTKHLRKRYFDNLNTLAFGGNIQDYVEKTNKIAGVGGVKVYPVWNGGGTVKLVISDSQHKKPSEMLVEAVQTAIDPIPNNGKGLGIAPIGHVVTVEGVEYETIDISTELFFIGGWDFDAILPYLETVIDDYFEELAAGWDKVDWRIDGNATLVVRISQLETRILALTGILDIRNTTLNGVAQNATLSPNSIPIRGNLTHEQTLD